MIDYFGDIRLIRNDFVHNKGICKESADLKVLHTPAPPSPNAGKAPGGHAGTPYLQTRPGVVLPQRPRPELAPIEHAPLPANR